MSETIKRLYVDLDDTLVSTDTLWERLLLLLKAKPLALFLIPFWILEGKARFKRKMSEEAYSPTKNWPLNPAVLDKIESVRSSGGEVILATAADTSIAHQVSAQAGGFDAILCSTESINLKGKNKLEAIQHHSGGEPFCYIGDCEADLPIWEACETALVVNPNESLRKKMSHLKQVEALDGPQDMSFRTIRKAMRIHQWAKNVLLLVPLLLSHQILVGDKLIDVLMALVGFGLTVSATYIWNDLLDIEADREHPSKCERPLAAGKLSIKNGIFLSLVIFSAGLLTSYFIDPGFFLLVCGYVALTLTYSFKLKSLLLVDVLMLGIFYTYRIIMGAEAADVVISPWLLAFSIFFFLSLGFVKRFSEIQNKLQKDNDPEVKIRGYFGGDISMVRSFGVASGNLSMLILALYLTSPSVAPLYNSPEWLWAICLILFYWLMRIWFLAQRNQMPEDPVLFAIHDKTSLIAGALIVVVAVLGTFV